MLAGLLVADLDDWPVDQTTLGTENDVHYLVFPRPGGIARLYLAFDIAEKDRFTGPDRVPKFLDAFRVDSLPLGEAVASATPAGPCAGHPGTNTWTERPVADGAVLVGDAAGWSDPLIGQGLSIAMRDARSVADVLLASDDWSPDAFTSYVDERAERMRRIRVVVDLMTDIRCDFSPEGRARRAAFFGGLLNDPLSIAMMVAMLSGAELADPEALEPENVARVRAMA
jgi:2-polyprenyl-6-methoxyphenol hydroxylase-like FAD-dependent oxidoreductase